MNVASRLLMSAAALVALATVADGEIYTWTDSRGNRHYTNSLYEVPTPYREKVKQLDLGLPAQKGDQPTGGQAPAAAPSPAPAVPPVVPPTVPMVGNPGEPPPAKPPAQPRRRRHIEDE